eukprot:g12035.t1
MANKHPGGYGERRRGFVRVERQEEEDWQPPSPSPQLVPSRAEAQVCFIQCGRRRFQVTAMLGIIVLYMLVSMSLTLLDKWLITGLGFHAPLTLICLTYMIMHLASLTLRGVVARLGLVDEARSGGANLLVQQLTWHQWAWKVFPVAAASGLEVGTSTLGLQVMHVGIHTMVRSTVPIFVLLFSVGLGLQELRCGLLVVVMLVSGGVSLMFSGQGGDHQADLPIEGFLLTLLSGMLAGLKWTLSQVLLQGRGLYGREAVTVGEQIHPFTLLHYMSISSAATLVPFVVWLERDALRDMSETFGVERMAKTALIIVLVGLLALLLVLTEFTFIKKVSSLSLCIIGVVKELILVLWSVAVRGEYLSERTGLGFFLAMVGVTLYKLVPKGPPQVRYEPAPKNGGQHMPSGRGSPSARLSQEGGVESGQNGHRVSNSSQRDRISGGQKGRDQVPGQRLPAVPNASRIGMGSGYFSGRHSSGTGVGAGAVWEAPAAGERSTALDRAAEVESLGRGMLESGTAGAAGRIGDVDVDVERLTSRSEG